MIVNKSGMMKTNSKIFGACRHKSKCHWLHVDGTEEMYCERVNKADLESDSDSS